MSVCTCICVSVYLYSVYTYIATRMHLHVRIYIYISTHMHVHVYIYICCPPRPVIYQFRPLKPNLTVAAVKSQSLVASFSRFSSSKVFIKELE